MPEDRSTPSLRISLFDTLHVEVDGVPVPESRWRRKKPRLLVELLALEPNHRLHREQVFDRLWPDLEPEAAANQLYKAVHEIRHALEPDLPPRGESRFLRMRDQMLGLEPAGDVWVDLEEFERLATVAVRTDDLVLADRALALYSGPLLGDELYEEWALARREQVRVRYLHLLAHAATRCAEVGREARAIDLYRAVLAEEPADEDAHRALMMLFARSGNRTAALNQYRACEEALRRELDAEPGAATVTLFAQITAETTAPGQTASSAAHLETRSASPATTLHGFSPVTEIGELTETNHPSTRTARLANLARIARRHPGMSALVALVCAILLVLPLLPTTRIQTTAHRLIERTELLLHTWGGHEPRLITLTGEVAAPRARIEALDSASGLATIADATGRFHLVNVLWYPETTYQLAITDETGTTRVVRVTAPERLSRSDFDIGQIPSDAGRVVRVHELSGLNSIDYLAVDATETPYFRGVFDTLAAGATDDAQRIAAVNRFVAARYVAGTRGPGIAPRMVMLRGSSFSGDLTTAFATIVRAGGYDVRLVSMADVATGRRVHRIAEVFYDGSWHAYDPAYGVSLPNSEGRIVSYWELLRTPGFVDMGAYRSIERPGWETEQVLELYRSGVHRYSYLRDPRAAGAERALRHGV